MRERERERERGREREGEGEVVFALRFNGVNRLKGYDESYSTGEGEAREEGGEKASLSLQVTGH